MASMAALRPKLLSILPLLLVINGINAQLFHFPHLPFLNHPFLNHPFFGGNGTSAAALAEGLDPRTGIAGTRFDPRAGKDQGRFAGSAGTATNSRTAGGEMIEFDPNAHNAAVIPTTRPRKGRQGRKRRGGHKGVKPVLPAFAGLLPKVLDVEPKPEPKPVVDAPPQPNFPTNFAGAWEVVQLDSGVSAMHLNLMPNNKIMMYDASAFHISNIKLPNGQCLPFKDDKGVDQVDCWSHAVEYDVNTNAVRPLKVLTDPWCSSGGLTAEGNFISTGGWMGGDRSVRYFDACDTCDFRYDVAMVLAEPRWYATQVTLPDGRFFLVGGRKSYSFEYVPPEGQVNQKAIFFPLLDETTDLDENNLYPFVHVSTDGNLWILANSRSVLLDPKTNTVIKEFPVLQGGSRNYPASGMSALLPIDLSVPNPPLVPAEVIVCGGAKPEAYGLAGKGNFIPALQDCARMMITDPNPVWTTELMPSARVMGDMLILPTGDLLLINGAQEGASAWFLAEKPNFIPVLYTPNNKPGTRFTNLNPTQIARMYHSSSAVLPNGKILVAGSNTNPGYDYKAKYPTELRVEHFAPPYLDPALAVHRPGIMVAESDAKLKYGQPFNVQFQLAEKATKADFKVTMYAPPFTTHGYSMNQRLLVLAKNQLVEAGPGVYRLQVTAPPSNVLAPPGYYLVFVVYRGVPSVGLWVQILN